MLTFLFPKKKDKTNIFADALTKFKGEKMTEENFAELAVDVWEETLKQHISSLQEVVGSYYDVFLAPSISWNERPVTLMLTEKRNLKAQRYIVAKLYQSFTSNGGVNLQIEEESREVNMSKKISCCYISIGENKQEIKESFERTLQDMVIKLSPKLS